MDLRDETMSYLMGIDLGTSSVKTVIINESGLIKSTAQSSYDILIPEKDYAEQDPEIWWNATVHTIQRALKEEEIQSNEIKGIGFSGQMHGMVLIDKNNNVIRPAIIWSDQRTKNEVKEIYTKLGKDYIGSVTLNHLSTGFQTPSLLWIKKHEPASYQKIYKVLLPKDYIRLKMTGELGTDVTDASATLAFDTKRRIWAEELILKLGLDPEIFPIVKNPTDVAGEVTIEAAKETGLHKGTLVVYGGGDQPMQAIGNGIVTPGQISLTIGTGGVVYSVTKEPKYDVDLRTHTFCNAVPETWNIMGANLASGLSLSWLNKNILSNLSYEELNILADSVTSGSEGLIFLPYLIGERTPHMDPEARGTFLGLTLKHNKAHLIRSVMEGVVFAFRDSIEIFKNSNVKMDKFIASGGGARSDIWLKIQANILNQEIYKVNQPEQACIGAAIVAGVGAGVYDSIEIACSKIIKFSDEPVQPDQKTVSLYNETYELYKEIYQQNKAIFHHLAGK